MSNAEYPIGEGYFNQVYLGNSRLRTVDQPYYVVDQGSYDQVSYPKPSKKQIWPVLLVVLIVIIIIGLVVYLILRKKATTTTKTGTTGGTGTTTPKICQADADCPSSQICDLASGKCVAPTVCVTNSDCPSPQGCNLSTGTCYNPPPTTCSSNNDCSSSERCNFTTHLCVQCISASDCDSTPTTPLCSSSGHCVQCTSNLNCHNNTPSTPVCDPAGTCVQCNSSADCVPGFSPHNTCNLATKTCVGCLTNTDCPSTTPLCNSTTNTCYQCAGDSDCTTINFGNTPHCDTNTNLCQQCLTNTDCPGATGLCDLNAQPNTNQCTCGFGNLCPIGTTCNNFFCHNNKCNSDSDCTTINSGLTPHCNANNTCVQCSTNSDCPDPVFKDCNQATGQCGCAGSTLCPTGTFCSSNLCV